MSRVTSRTVFDGSAVMIERVMISLTLFVSMENLRGAARGPAAAADRGIASGRGPY